MDINELIEQGIEIAKASFHSSSTVGDYYSSVQLAEWLALSARFVESNFPGDPDTIRFRKLSLNANGGYTTTFDELIAILRAFDEIPPRPIIKDITHIIKEICNNFNKFDIAIKRRYNNRPTIEINDEYDLQNALLAILKLFINDIRPEDYVPSYAGGNSRVDFLLPEHGIIIETKMASSTLRDKAIGEQLMIDFNRYKELEKCNQLICFIYDKDSHISNPYGLITDLEKLSSSEMRMSVIISPQ